jgi:hypothetical protein
MKLGLHQKLQAQQAAEASCEETARWAQVPQGSCGTPARSNCTRCPRCQTADDDCVLRSGKSCCCCRRHRCYCRCRLRSRLRALEERRTALEQMCSKDSESCAAFAAFMDEHLRGLSGGSSELREQLGKVAMIACCCRRS